MGRPYNKKTVEEAALLAETMASNPHLGDMQWVALFLGIRESSTAFTLAREAFLVGDGLLSPAIRGLNNFEYMCEVWAEAAALIADGWQIGDEVVLLNHVDVIADKNVPQDRVYLLNKNADGSLTPAAVFKNVLHIVEPAVTSIAESPMSDEMKAKTGTALEAMTTAPVETEAPVNVLAEQPLVGANVMDENGLEPVPFNFYAQDDDSE